MTLQKAKVLRELLMLRVFSAINVERIRVTLELPVMPDRANALHFWEVDEISNALRLEIRHARVR